MSKKLLEKIYKEMVNELIELDTILENRFETIAAIGDEYVETIDVEETRKRVDVLNSRIRELEKIFKK